MMLFFYLSIAFFTGVVVGSAWTKLHQVDEVDEVDEVVEELHWADPARDERLGPYRQAGEVDEDEDDEERLTVPAFESDFSAEPSHEDQVVVYNFDHNVGDPFVAIAKGKTIKEIRTLIGEYKSAAEKLEAQSMHELKSGYSATAHSTLQDANQMKKRVQKLELIISKHKTNMKAA